MQDFLGNLTLFAHPDNASYFEGLCTGGNTLGACAGRCRAVIPTGVGNADQFGKFTAGSATTQRRAWAVVARTAGLSSSFNITKVNHSLASLQEGLQAISAIVGVKC